MWVCVHACVYVVMWRVCVCEWCEFACVCVCVARVCVCVHVRACVYGSADIVFCLDQRSSRAVQKSQMLAERKHVPGANQFFSQRHTISR